MKSFIIFLMMLLIGAWAQSSNAVTFPDNGNVKISAEKNNGKVHVVGNAVENYISAKDIQFCPDQIKYTVGCGLNWPINAERISPTEAVFQLDLDAVKRGQRAFNFKKGAQWSQVYAFKTGEYVVVEMSDPNPDSEDGRGGCHYVYVGDLPAGSYIPNKPELCGGGYAKPAASTAVASGVKKTASAVKSHKKADGSICKEPCIEEIKQNTREIKADVKEVKSGVYALMSSVGKPDVTDENDEKTLHQKSRKILKHVKKIDKNVGESKTGRSLHDKLGESKRKNGQLIPVVEEMHKDIKDIKSHLNIQPAILKDCAACHNDGEKNKFKIEGK